MASNFGTGLTYGNRKVHTDITSVPLSSTIINQQSAISASAMQIRRKFESTTQCRRIRGESRRRYARDRRTIREFPINAYFLRKLSTNRRQ